MQGNQTNIKQDPAKSEQCRETKPNIKQGPSQN